MGLVDRVKNIVISTEFIVPFIKTWFLTLFIGVSSLYENIIFPEKSSIISNVGLLPHIYRNYCFNLIHPLIDSIIKSEMPIFLKYVISQVTMGYRAVWKKWNIRVEENQCTTKLTHQDKWWMVIQELPHILTTMPQHIRFDEDTKMQLLFHVVNLEKMCCEKSKLFFTMFCFFILFYWYSLCWFGTISLIILPSS